MNTYSELFTHNHTEVTSSEIKNATNDEFNCHWLTESASWDKEKFAGELVRFIEQTQGVNAFPNLILIGVLAQQIDLYVQCSHQIANSGLLEVYNKGVTSGPSPYFSMADKSLNRILQIMKELGITPSHRVGVVRARDPESLELEELFAVA